MPFVAVAFAVAILLLAMLKRRRPDRRGLDAMPHPIRVPFIGHFYLFLFKSTSDVCLGLYKKYGPIFSLQMGQIPVVVSNDYNSLREILLRPVFCDRPRNEVLGVGLASVGNRATAFADYSDSFRKNFRNLINKHAYGPSQKSDMHAVVEGTVRAVCQGDPTLTERESVKIWRCSGRVVFDALCQQVFGNTYAPEEFDLEKYCINVEGMVDNFGALTSDYFPWLRRFIPSYRREAADAERFVENTWEMTRFLLGDYFKCREERTSCFCDLLLKKAFKEAEGKERQVVLGKTTAKDALKETNDDSSRLYEEGLITGMIMDFMLAAIDAVPYSVKWMFAELTCHPEIQARAREEVLSVYGKDGFISYDFCTETPFTMAVLKESTRRHVGPFITIRMAKEDTTLFDYTIPKGTIIWPHLFALHHDKDVWGDDAFDFRPERFLVDDSEKRRLHAEYWMLFSAGPRSCIGNVFAMSSMYVFLCEMLRSYTWEAVHPLTLEHVSNQSKRCEDYYLKLRKLHDERKL
eukprot:m.83404 g.83404  ORF g.83404 m.83404 type:complete len:520 (+) comp36343_c0_seq1:46-1605(+)